MTYDEAITAVVQRKTRMMRPHWCWCWLVKPNKTVKIERDDDPSNRERYTPTRADRLATDWVEVAD